MRFAAINTVVAAHPQLLMISIDGFGSSISLPHLKHLTFFVGFCISAKKSFINSPAFIILLVKIPFLDSPCDVIDKSFVGIIIFMEFHTSDTTIENETH